MTIGTVLPQVTTTILAVMLIDTSKVKNSGRNQQQPLLGMTLMMTLTTTIVALFMIGITAQETVHGFATAPSLHRHNNIPSPATGQQIGTSPPLLSKQSTIFPRNHPSSCSVPKCSSSLMSLQALPTTLLSSSSIPMTWTTLGLVLVHVVLGASPVPFVVNGTKQGGWYRRIQLPSWTPPDKLFAPVWTTLYACMGLAVSIISSSTTISIATKKKLVWYWVVHFALNLSWAPTFFGRQQFRLGCFLNVLMMNTLGLTIIPKFYSVDPTAGLLLVPYMAWLTFATLLNAKICALNPTTKGYNDGMLQAQIQKLQEDAAKYADGQ